MHGDPRPALTRHAERTVHLFDGRVVEDGEAADSAYRFCRFQLPHTLWQKFIAAVWKLGNARKILFAPKICL